MNSEKILVTGAAGGMGNALCLMLKDSGAFVIAADKSECAVCDTQYNLDLTSEGAPETLCKKLNADGHKPTCVVHLMGGRLETDTQPPSAETMAKTMRLNLTAATEINSFIIPAMVEAGGGKIIHISSDAAENGNASPCYVAAKSAVNAYVRSSARYYGEKGVLICAVAPGITEHPTSDWTQKKITNPDYYNARINMMPLKRFLRADETAEIILAVIRMKGMALNGSVITANGGL